MLSAARGSYTDRQPAMTSVRSRSAHRGHDSEGPRRLDTLGNQRALRLLRQLTPRIQAKPGVGTRGDAHEREAERIADTLSVPAHTCTCGGTCARCKAEKSARRQALHRAGQPLRGASRDLLPPVIDRVVRSLGEPLNREVRCFFEHRFGVDLSGVRVHRDADAAAATREVSARAFTFGRDIVFDPREYAPHTTEGRRLIAHELVHVIQQSGGTTPGASGAMQCPGAPLAVKAVTPPMVARGEKWDAFWGVGPWDAYKASELATKALAAAKKTGLPGLRNGPADAWRHCYWNCLMTDEIGRDQARFVADNHEEHGSGPAIENLMDSRNNWEGRECGVGKSDCDTCCQTKLDTGVLDVIEGGKMVPSRRSSRSGGQQRDKYEY